MRHILKCGDCGQYTMKKECSKCNTKTINPKPAKYSVDDRMAKYRRLAKKPELIKRNLL